MANPKGNLPGRGFGTGKGRGGIEYRPLYTLKEAGEMITKIQGLLEVQARQHRLHLEGFSAVVREQEKLRERLASLEQTSSDD